MTHFTHDPVNEPVDTTTGLTGAVVTPARVLRDAALYLDRHGWTQGSYYDQTATVFTPAACMVGAIGMVCYGGPVDAPAQHFDAPEWADFDAAVRYLDEIVCARRCGNVYEFNDVTGRTVAEVIAMLADVADQWDRENDESASNLDTTTGGVA